MSKKCFGIAFLPVILFFAFLNISGQEKLITEQDFSAIEYKAYQNLKGKIYRLRKTTEHFLDRNAGVWATMTQISEFVPPDRSRFVFNFKSPSINNKTETIRIGRESYVRTDDGVWEESTTSGTSTKSIKISANSTTTYKFIEKTTLNNQIVNVYEATSEDFTYLPYDRKAKVMLKVRYWITEDGFFIKCLAEEETVEIKKLKRETSVYEYNPKNIKIEAPISDK